jgi:hypothetical protein
MDSTPEALEMADDDIIFVTPVEPRLMFSDTDEVNRLIETSTAPIILKIALANGATVRSGMGI